MNKLWEKVIHDRTKCEQTMNKIEQNVNKKRINYEQNMNENEFWYVFEWIWMNLSENLMKIIDIK